MNKGVKFRAYPTKEQQNLINQTFGCYREDRTCYLEYSEYIPKGGDEADLSWDWTCSKCDADLTDRYEDLDVVEKPEEIGLFYCPHCGARILGTRYRKDDDSER